MPPLRPGSFLSRVFGQPEKRSITPPVGTVMGDWGAPHTFKPKQSLEAYGDNVWLYGAVQKIAFEVAKTEFKLRKKQSKSDEIQYVEKHQALSALSRPQPAGQKSLLTAFDLKFITAMHVLLAGEAFWVLDKRLSPEAGGSPRFIDIARPDLMYPLADERTGDLTGYKYRPGTDDIRLPLEDVCHFRLPDPLNPFRGHAPTQSIRYSLDNQFEADLRNLKLLKNNSVPGGILNVEQVLDEEKARRLRTQWQGFQGGGENAGKLAVLSGGKMTYQQVQMSNEEMQFIQGKEIGRDEVLAAYGVGLEIFGKTESQTRANADTAVFVFMKFGVAPFLIKLNDSLNNDFLTAFAGSEGLEFCFDDPVPENTEEKRATAGLLFDKGAMTPDEMRKMFGLEPLNIAGVSDVPYMPLGAVPAGFEPEPDPPTYPLEVANTNT